MDRRGRSARTATPTEAEPSPEWGAPIFLIGMGRSGSTRIFEAMACHPELGFFSARQDQLPRLPLYSLWTRLWIDRPKLWRHERPAGEPGHWWEHLQDRPSEGYRIWEACCGAPFRDEFLLGQSAGEAERRAIQRFSRCVLRYQGRQRLLAKFTGPPRITYLRSLFPHPTFVHVVRDPRAVVPSLLAAPFWKRRGGKEGPAWRGGFRPEDREDCERHGWNPVAVAAVHWRRVTETVHCEGRNLPPGQLVELRYEDFVREPAQVLKGLWRGCGLAPADSGRALAGSAIRNRNPSGSSRLGPREREIVDALTRTQRQRYGYADAEPSAS